MTREEVEEPGSPLSIGDKCMAAGGDSGGGGSSCEFVKESRSTFKDVKLGFWKWNGWAFVGSM